MMLRRSSRRRLPVQSRSLSPPATIVPSVTLSDKEEESDSDNSSDGDHDLDIGQALEAARVARQQRRGNTAIQSDSEEETEDEDCTDDEAVPPSPRYECNSMEDGSDEEEGMSLDGSKNNEDEDSDDDTALNLRCMKSILAYYSTYLVTGYHLRLSKEHQSVLAPENQAPCNEHRLEICRLW